MDLDKTSHNLIIVHSVCFHDLSNLDCIWIFAADLGYRQIFSDSINNGRVRVKMSSLTAQANPMVTTRRFQICLV